MLIDIAHAVGGYLHDVFIGNADWGILVGYVAQILFAMRFVVQWIASERAGLDRARQEEVVLVARQDEDLCLGLGVLEQVARCPGAQRVEDLVVIVIYRQDDDMDLG